MIFFAKTSLVELYLLFLCLLYRSEDYGVHSFSTRRLSLFSLQTQKVTFHRRIQESSGILSPTKRSESSWNVHRSNKSDDDRTNIGLNNDEGDDTDNQPWFFKITDGMNGGMGVLPEERGLSFVALDLAVAKASESVIKTTNTNTTVRSGPPGIAIWIVSMCAFLLGNSILGPWPRFLFESIPDRFWLLGHIVGAMLFGGGIILTACMEWLVARSKNVEVMQFWFGKVPLLDTAIVLPGLTLSMVSGTALSTNFYGGLGNAPVHIVNAMWALVVFAGWWGLTDLTTQGIALEAVLKQVANPLEESEAGETPKQESENQAFESLAESYGRTGGKNYVVSTQPTKSSVLTEVPAAVNARMFSNAVSCGLVLILYAIKVLKIGTM